MKWRRTLATARWTATIVAIALAAFWGFSCWWGGLRFGPRIGVEFGMGLIGVKEFIPEMPDQDASYFARLDPPGLRWSFLHVRSPGNYNGYFIPLWAPFLLAAGVAASFWRVHYRRTKLPFGACPSCGYDRRGLASPAVNCPECGTPPTPAFK